MCISYKPIIEEHNSVFILINVALNCLPRFQKENLVSTPSKRSFIGNIYFAVISLKARQFYRIDTIIARELNL